MELLKEIRRLYKPVQPSVKNIELNVAYEEFTPNVNLQPYIFCYWQLKSTEPLLESFKYTVVSDGCIDIFFDVHRTDESFIMGFCNQYQEFELGTVFNYFGIRFLPAMFPKLFNISASKLSNRCEPLLNIIPSTANFIAKNFIDKLSISQNIEVFDDYFTGLFDRVNMDVDLRLLKALAKVLESSGVIDIEKDLDTGISIRQLRRLFNFYIGATPKSFGKVIRFQNILSAEPTAQSLRQSKLFFDAGYYDQSHFVKEFKNYFGTTPGAVFKK